MIAILPAAAFDPPCKCFVIPKDELCPVHGLDRSETTEHPSRVKPSDRVVNTTDSLRRPK